MFSFFSGNKEDTSHIYPELSTPKTDEDFEKLLNDTFEYAFQCEKETWNKIELDKEKYGDIELFQKDAQDGVYEFKVVAKMEGVKPKEINDMRYTSFEEKKKFEKDLLLFKVIKELEPNNKELVLAQRSAPTPVSSRGEDSLFKKFF
eukprot:TRINITY_DN7753_c0_g1_i2.p2 TRINITY_DN7753_c0_g1~~TRINITY_DN7753_c0_g1_i2.p2  ORF type:complete len:147 (+),score=53.26 TRINITY_DN7753_c0_g1_i2:954-1394(+)